METVEKEIFERFKYTDKKEWLSLRGKGIGGSDASVVLGYNQWKTNNDLWREKVYGLVSEKNDLDENEQVIYGKTVEDALRVLFQAKFVEFLEVKHTEEVLVRIDKPHIRASLDGEINVLKDFVFIGDDKVEYPLKKGMRGIWENKTSYMPKKEKWDKKIPMPYYCQILHYLLTTNFDFVIVSVEMTYQNGSSVIKHFCYLKEGRETDLVFLEKKEDEFWKKVVDKEEPPMRIKF